MKDRPWHPLENRVLALLREHGIHKSKVLVAVSGGLDSSVLLHILERLRHLQELDLAVIHVHHGGTGPQRRFRDQAGRFVEQKARAYGFPFFTNDEPPETELTGEAELRAFRYQNISSVFRDRKFQPEFQYVVLAQHRDDLLETRMIRLIRGTGAGGLRAMSTLRGEKLRPLLQERRKVLEEYAKETGVQWVEDPSNRSRDPLRNWIRHEWLPLLETKRPGAANSLGRSLDNVVNQTQLAQSPVTVSISSEGVSRTRLVGLSRPEQRRALVAYLHHIGVEHFSVTQLDEILKRLGSPKRAFDFRVLGCEWRVNAEYIRAFVEEKPDSTRNRGNKEK